MALANVLSKVLVEKKLAMLLIVFEELSPFIRVAASVPDLSLLCWVSPCYCKFRYLHYLNKMFMPLLKLH